MNLRITFENLSEENNEFLRLRVNEKSCPSCSRKAIYKIEKNLTIIDGVCCDRFAIMIGSSLSVRNINEYAVEFRGKILNVFSNLEVYIDTIIELSHSKFQSMFPDKPKTGIADDLNMRERKKMFKACLDKYNSLTGNKIEKIWGHFNNIVERRNQLAHWPVDTSKDGVALLMRTNRIRFIKMNGLQIVAGESYNSRTTILTERMIRKLQLDILDIYAFYRDYNQSGF